MARNEGNNRREKIVFERVKLLGTLKKESKPHIHEIVETLSLEYGKIIKSGQEYRQFSKKKWGRNIRLYVCNAGSNPAGVW